MPFSKKILAEYKRCEITLKRVSGPCAKGRTFPPAISIVGIEDNAVDVKPVKPTPYVGARESCRISLPLLANNYQQPTRLNAFITAAKKGKLALSLLVMR